MNARSQELDPSRGPLYKQFIQEKQGEICQDTGIRAMSSQLPAVSACVITGMYNIVVIYEDIIHVARNYYARLHQHDSLTLFLTTYAKGVTYKTNWPCLQLLLTQALQMSGGASTVLPTPWHHMQAIP